MQPRSEPNYASPPSLQRYCSASIPIPRANRDPQDIVLHRHSIPHDIEVIKPSLPHNQLVMLVVNSRTVSIGPNRESRMDEIRLAIDSVKLREQQLEGVGKVLGSVSEDSGLLGGG